MQRQTVGVACAVAALALGVGSLAHAADAAAENRAAQSPPSWSSPSLRSETVVGPNGAVTTRAALLANDKWGIGDTKRVERVTDGVYAMRGWGIASSFAIEAPSGWIIVDTGDYTQAAAEMRASSRQTLGRKIKVAAILLTHWHYGERHRRVSRRWRGGLGTRAPGPQPPRLDRHQRPERHLPGTGGRPVRRFPSARAAPTRFRTSSASRPRSCWPSPATSRPRGSSRTAASSTSSSPASRCRSLPSGRTRATASASISRASACS